MFDDRLFLHVDYKYGPIEVDGNYNPSILIAPQAMRHGDYTPDLATDSIALFNMADESLEDTLHLIKKIAQAQKQHASRKLILCKVATTSECWRAIVDHGKDIIFLQGKVLDSTGKPYPYPLALIIFYGELKGSPMVFTLNVDSLPPSDGFNRKAMLYARHIENKRVISR
jgi:hypothetical protein